MTHVIQDFFDYFVFTEGLSVSDIIGWMLTFLAGVFAFKLIDHMQTAMERHNMLSAIEDGFSNLYDMVVALHIPDLNTMPTADTAKQYSVMVRSVLHDDTRWDIIEDENKDIEYKILNNQRYIHIRNNEKNGKFYNEWISTQALHEITLKARRVEKMFKDGIIKRVDLADMFRELIPLGMSGRIELLERYYGKYDMDCLGYLIMQTVVSCDLYGNEDTIKGFAKYYHEHEGIHKYFIESKRSRLIRDRFAVKRFNQLMEKYKNVK